MNGHLHGTRKQQERADTEALAWWWWALVGVGSAITIAAIAIAVAPILWAISEVSLSTHPNPGAPSIIVIYSLGAVTIAILIVRAWLKKPAKAKARKPLPPLPQEADYMYIDTEGAAK